MEAMGIHGQAAYATTAQVINNQALTLGANDIFLMLAALFVVLVPFVWLAKPPFRAVGTGGMH
jgi:DHA2 family multidrug resistance protein